MTVLPENRPTARALLTGRARKTWLAVHIASSVGWLGGAYCMLVLSLTGLLAPDRDLRIAAYELMHLFDRAVNIPLGFLALGTGLVVSLRTRWGLFRHWWVTVKLIATCLTMVAAPLLSVPRVLAAVDGLRSGAHLGSVPAQIAGVATAVVATLTVVTTVSVFKPWGRVRTLRRCRRTGS